MRKNFDEETEALIDWFLDNLSSLPDPPFQVERHRKILDRRYYDVLQRDIKKGPSSPRGSYGAVQHDLRALFRFVNPC